MPAPLPPETLAELRRLAEAATPGPWMVDDEGDDVAVIVDEGDEFSFIQITADLHQGDDGLTDARLIVAAVNALPALLDAAAERDALAARLAASEAIGGYAVIHEWPHPNGSLSLGFASSPDLDFDAADNHLAYCEAMQERGQRGSEGRYFIARWTPVDTGADR